MTRRPFPPGVTALLVVLAMLGLGATGVGVAVALGVGTSSSSPGPVAPGPAAPGRAATGPAASPPAVPAVTPPGEEPPGTAATTSVAREVLREWDRRRGDAWLAADAQALSALYVPGSVAGRRDVALLGRWTSRGAEVTRLDTQVLTLRVLRDVDRHLVLEVTDRLVVEASVAGARLDLPRDGPTTRRIELRRGPRITSAWRVAAVRVGPRHETPGSVSR